MPPITKTCRISGKPFDVTEWEQKFLEKNNIPLPTLSPMMRLLRRATFRKDMGLYRRKCDKSGQDVISFYHQNAPFPVWHNDYWHSDEFDGTDYGLDYDPKRSFFEQFMELQHRVPRPHLNKIRCEDSEYIGNSGGCKNCYMIFASDESENCMYGYVYQYTKDSMDCFWPEKSELLYECILVKNSFRIQHAFKVENSKDSMFLWDCRSVSNCLGCVGLEHKEYYIFNQPYTKEEYMKKKEEYKLHTLSGRQAFIQQWEQFLAQQDKRTTYISNSENCTGNFIMNSKDCEDAYLIFDMEHVKHVVFGGYKVKDCLDYTFAGYNANNCYETLGVSLGAYDCHYSAMCWTDNKNLMYSDVCINACEELFGCIGLKKKKYCILNTQYTKEEYFALKEKVIEDMKQRGEWGEFFPMVLSPSPLNESVSCEFFGMSREQMNALIAKDEHCQKLLEAFPERISYMWKEADPIPEGLAYDELPDDIHEIGDKKSFLVECSVTKKPFQIQQRELAFYIKMGIPLPNVSPQVREAHRKKMIVELMWGKGR